MEFFVNLDDFERSALNLLGKSVASYYKSGANEEHTLRENRESFKRYIIRPRFMRDVSRVRLNTTLLGLPVACPIAISPSAMQKLCHPDGEIATSRAAERQNVLMTLSTLSTTSLEDVVSAGPGAPKWFQLYMYRDRKLSEQIIRRAEKAGYKGLVLTVDAPRMGTRYADVLNNLELPSHLRLANFDGMSLDGQNASEMSKDSSGSGLSLYSKKLFDPSLVWADLRWLADFTFLPIIVKGILTGEDAHLAVQFGASAVIVSNHGARQLDYSPATIDALPEVVRAVRAACESSGKNCEVYMDGGVRTGTDVFKALALGARCVFLGRPVLWGLTCGGEEGVVKVLQLLLEETELAMMLSGFASLEKLWDAKNVIVTRDFYGRL